MNGGSLIQMRSAEQRHIKLLKIPLGVLADLLRLDGTTLVKIKGFPPDGVIQTVGFDQNTNQLVLTVESREYFRAIDDGWHLDTMPSLTASITSIQFPE